MARLSEFADLDSALEHILMGIFILDREGNYLYVNEQYCQSIGRPPEFVQQCVGTGAPGATNGDFRGVRHRSRSYDPLSDRGHTAV